MAADALGNVSGQTISLVDTRHARDVGVDGVSCGFCSRIFENNHALSQARQSLLNCSRRYSRHLDILPHKVESDSNQRCENIFLQISVALQKTRQLSHQALRHRGEIVSALTNE